MRFKEHEEIGPFLSRKRRHLNPVNYTSDEKNLKWDFVEEFIDLSVDIPHVSTGHNSQTNSSRDLMNNSVTATDNTLNRSNELQDVAVTSSLTNQCSSTIGNIHVSAMPKDTQKAMNSQNVSYTGSTIQKSPQVTSTPTQMIQPYRSFIQSAHSFIHSTKTVADTNTIAHASHKTVDEGEIPLFKKTPDYNFYILLSETSTVTHLNKTKTLFKYI